MACTFFATFVYSSLTFSLSIKNSTPLIFPDASTSSDENPAHCRYKHNTKSLSRTVGIFLFVPFAIASAAATSSALKNNTLPFPSGYFSAFLFNLF